MAPVIFMFWGCSRTLRVVQTCHSSSIQLLLAGVKSAFACLVLSYWLMSWNVDDWNDADTESCHCSPVVVLVPSKNADAWNAKARNGAWNIHIDLCLCSPVYFYNFINTEVRWNRIVKWGTLRISKCHHINQTDLKYGFHLNWAQRLHFCKCLRVIFR